MNTVDITAITATGDRPDAFDLCWRWMQRQTVIPVQWIVVDDGKVATDVTGWYPRLCTDYIRREPGTYERGHTLPENLLKAIPLVKTKGVVFFEDDEYYFPTYIETMERWLRSGRSVVGQAHSLYYRITDRKWRMCDNTAHASL